MQLPLPALLVLLLALAVYRHLYTMGDVPLSIALQEWRAEGEYLLVDDRDGGVHSLFVRVAGEERLREGLHGDVGSILLCLHGFPTSSFDFREALDVLAARGEEGEEVDDIVVTFDFLGFGFSDKPRFANYSIALQADFAEQVLAQVIMRNELDAKWDVHILSHDYGNPVAQEILARRKTDVQMGHESRTGLWRNLRTVAFTNGSLLGKLHRPLLIQRLLLNAFTGPIVSQLTSFTLFSRNMVKIFSPEHQPTTEQLEEWWSLIRKGGGATMFDRLIHYMRDRETEDERWIDAVLHPTTELDTRPAVVVGLLNGLLDPVSGAHVVAALEDAGFQGPIERFPSLGHYPMVEDASAFVDGYLSLRETMEWQL